MKQSNCAAQTLELSSQKVKPKANKQTVIYAALSRLPSNSEH